MNQKFKKNSIYSKYNYILTIESLYYHILSIQHNTISINRKEKNVLTPNFWMIFILLQKISVLKKCYTFFFFYLLFIKETWKIISFQKILRSKTVSNVDNKSAF